MRVEVVVLRRRLPRRPVHTTRAPDLDRLGKGVSAAAPGSIHGLQLIVQNIEVACAELADRGVNVTAGLHDIGSVLYHSSPAYEVPGAGPDRRSCRSFARDPDGNDWVVQEVRERAPGR